jgi:hypothetical protein
MNEFERLKAQKDTLVAKEKASVAVSVGLAIYARMTELAMKSDQVVGEKQDYYVTLRQLEEAFVKLRDELAGGA